MQAARSRSLPRRIDAIASSARNPRAANLGTVDELDFIDRSDVVLFELPTYEDSQAFRVHFGPRWPGWSADDEEPAQARAA